jgi:hypothetical protein
MEEFWTEPDAGFSGEQVERGRRLVSRDDLLTNEKQRTRLEIGDLLLEVAPIGENEAHNGSKKIIAAFSRQIGLADKTAIEYRSVASYCNGSMRERIAQSGVTVAYSVVREAAIGYSLDRTVKDDERALPTEVRAQQVQARFDALLRLIAEPGRKRVTAQEYREAIGAQQIPNSASAMTPEKIAEQLARPEVREAVFAAVAEDPEMVREARMAFRSPESLLRDAMMNAFEGDEVDPSEQFALEFLHTMGRSFKVLDIDPDEFMRVDDPKVWEAVLKFRVSVDSWSDRVLSNRPVPTPALGGAR